VDPVACLFHSDRYIEYDFGSEHPMQQRRLLDVRERIHTVPGIDAALEVREPVPATDSELQWAHAPEYVAAVRRLSSGDFGDARRWGLGPGDTPAFVGIHEASARYCGGTLGAARCVSAGSCGVAINLAGGLHHAFADHASGFCVYNDIALGVRCLQQSGYRRVAYVDIDVHHGDGVEAIFRSDPDVLTISLHESGEWLFPGTGRATDRGTAAAANSVVDLPFAPGTGDDLWWLGFERVVPKILDDFQPDALVLQIGADAHFADPLAHMRLTSRGWLRAFTWLLEYGKELPVVVTGGGGYDRETVVRLWSMAVVTAAGLAVPESWHDAWVPEEASGEQAEKLRRYTEARIAEALAGR